MRDLQQRLATSEHGSVAPTVALSLFALIASAGIAFDYARLVTVDTEMQHAADQAALAAATQLDGQAGAVARATAAAQAMFSNIALEANDGTAITVGINDVLFYATKAAADAENGTDCPTTDTVTTDAAARFVCVRTVNRTAKFALTPVVGAISAPNLSAMAVAGMGSSICKVPPLMMCNPQETSTVTTFDVNSYKGVGIRLVQGGGAGASWGPGSFGYLQSDGSGAAVDLEYALAANNPPGDCLPTGSVLPKTGVAASVVDGINARFDIYANDLTNACTTANCKPALNVRKDLVRPASSTNYGTNGQDGWKLPTVPYLPNSAGVQTSIPSAMGHPRDICHSTDPQNCPAGRIGNGVWDRNMYFYVNHRGLYTTTTAGVPDDNWKNIASLSAYATAQGITLASISRYDVYKWELAQDALAPYSAGVMGNGANAAEHFNYGRPIATAGLGAGPTQLDRRLTSVAVINCLANPPTGTSNPLYPIKWVELFLVEPSIARARTDAADIYVEVVRTTTAGGAAPTNPQVVRRDVPYLVK